jgi:hypothetical protein
MKSKPKSKRSAPKWLLWIILVVAIALIILRLCLPYILIDYATKQINKIPGYHVKIPDLDVHLWRGSYAFKGLELNKIQNSIPVPFFKSDILDLSVEWRALFQGAFVAKIVATHPVVNFVTDDKGHNEQLTISSQWLDIVKTLFPLKFNRIEAQNGEVYFRSYTSDPPFKIFLNKLDMQMTNLQNADHSSKLLYATYKVTAESGSKGSLEIDGKFNPVIKTPTFYISVSLKGLSVVELKSFLKSYTKVDMKGGTFSLYGEAAAADGKIKGYVKPFIKNLQIGSTKPQTNPFQAVYNGAAAVVAKIIENHQKHTIATQVNISGNVNHPNDSILSIIGYMLRHAFIQALIPSVDNTIKMRDVLIGDDSPPPVRSEAPEAQKPAPVRTHSRHSHSQ